MKIHPFVVVPSLPETLRHLSDLAGNLFWTWNPEAMGLFRRLDRELWEDLYRYIRAVQADPDPDRQETGRKLNKRMRQITKDAKKEAGLEEEPEEE